MRRPSVLLPKVIKFREELVVYGNHLLAAEHDAANAMRAGLNVQWGELQPDLDELEIPRFWQQFGRTFPTFETALMPPSDRFDSLTLDSLRFAVSTLESAIGRLRRIDEEGTPIHRSFWLAAFVFVFVAGWLLRHFQDRLLLLRRLPSASTWGNLKVSLVTLAVAGSGICGNLFAGVIQADGWTRGLRRHPFQFIFYLLLTIALALFAAFAAASGPSS